MSRFFYDGPVETPPSPPIRAEGRLRGGFNDPRGYLPSPALKRATHAALLLNQPLLLSGEPGVGKTEFAHALAHALGYGDGPDGRAIELVARSTMSAQDLFYEFDHLRRLYDRNVRKESAPDASYFRARGLGKAILLAGGPDRDTELAPHGDRPMRFDALMPREQFVAPSLARRVVLIDEIDKAPRDVLNDLLNEIDRMTFEIPELGQRVSAPAGQKPVVVITTNLEKQLPGPFLRRCVYHHIDMPRSRAETLADGARPPDEGEVFLEDIVEQRLRALRRDEPLVRDAVALFCELRSERYGLYRRPSPAELLSFLALLSDQAGALGRMEEVRRNGLRGAADVALGYLCVLFKESADLRSGVAIVKEWLDPKRRAAGQP